MSDTLDKIKSLKETEQRLTDALKKFNRPRNVLERHIPICTKKDAEILKTLITTEQDTKDAITKTIQATKDWIGALRQLSAQENINIMGFKKSASFMQTINDAIKAKIAFDKSVADYVTANVAYNELFREKAIILFCQHNITLSAHDMELAERQNLLIRPTAPTGTGTATPSVQ